MAHVPPEVHSLFQRQHGVASTAQLADLDVGRNRVEHLVRRGDLISMMRGVVRSPSVVETELTRSAAVSLAHPLVAIAGPTAGRIWELRRMSNDRRIHVLAPRHWRATAESWCTAYRTDARHDDDVLVRPDGIRVTTRQRTALDLTRSIPDDDRLLSIIEQVAHDGGLRDGDLRAVAHDWVLKRAWVARFLGQLDRRLEGPAAESEPEVRVGNALSDAGIRGLVRQWPVDLPGYGSARFDLAIPELRIAIEVDVFPTHRETVGAANDVRRDLAAAADGWSVRRITALAYATQFRAEIQAITAEICFRSRSQ